MFKNCFLLLCAPNTPSLVDATGYYDPNAAPPVSSSKSSYTSTKYNKSTDHPYPKQQAMSTHHQMTTNYTTEQPPKQQSKLMQPSTSYCDQAIAIQSADICRQHSNPHHQTTNTIVHQNIVTHHQPPPQNYKDVGVMSHSATAMPSHLANDQSKLNNNNNIVPSVNPSVKNMPTNHLGK